MPLEKLPGVKDESATHNNLPQRLRLKNYMQDPITEQIVSIS